MYKLSPSLLAADFSRLKECIEQIEKGKADYLHIDVMDGMFVPCISFGTPVIASIRTITKIPFDVHLMVKEPDRLLPDFVEAGADMITVHSEACTHLHRTVHRIKEYGKRVCVALNPMTSLNDLEYIIEDLDMVLIMLVNPGYGGQKMIPATVRKVQQLRKMCEERGISLDIEVDGGVNKENVGQILEAGANVIVAGTAVFQGNIEENVKKFRELFEMKAGS